MKNIEKILVIGLIVLFTLMIIGFFIKVLSFLAVLCIPFLLVYFIYRLIKGDLFKNLVTTKPKVEPRQYNDDVIEVNFEEQDIS